MIEPQVRVESHFEFATKPLPHTGICHHRSHREHDRSLSQGLILEVSHGQSCRTVW